MAVEQMMEAIGRDIVAGRDAQGRGKGLYGSTPARSLRSTFSSAYGSLVDVMR